MFGIFSSSHSLILCTTNAFLFTKSKYLIISNDPNGTSVYDLGSVNKIISISIFLNQKQLCDLDFEQL